MVDILRDLPFPNYRAIEAANAHGLIQMRRSPAHFLHSRKRAMPPSPAMQLGIATHMAISQPDEFNRTVFVQPDFNVRTKTGRAERDIWLNVLPEEAVVLTQEQHGHVIAMRNAVMARADIRPFFSDGEAELTLLWRDDEFGVDCKARLDWICDGHNLIIDIKTCKDASEQAIIRSCANFSYWLQDSWYTAAAEACGFGEREFAFLFVESEPPYGVAMYSLDPQAKHAAHILTREALATYAECLRTNQYPGYDSGIKTVSLPPWAIK